MINNILLAFFTFAGFLFQTSATRIVNGTVDMKEMSIVREDGPLRAEVRTGRVSIVSSEGRSGGADIAMLYEPQSRLFWWCYRAVESEQPGARGKNPLEDYLVYIAGDKVFGFSFSRPDLWVRESSEHFSSMDEGQGAVLAEINIKAGGIEAGPAPFARAVNIGVALGSDFLSLKGSASPFPGAKLRNVTRKDGQWHLILDGPNKDLAEVVLSDDYQIISTTRFARREQ